MLRGRLWIRVAGIAPARLIRCGRVRGQQAHDAEEDAVRPFVDSRAADDDSKLAGWGAGSGGHVWRGQRERHLPACPAARAHRARARGIQRLHLAGTAEPSATSLLVGPHQRRRTDTEVRHERTGGRIRPEVAAAHAATLAAQLDDTTHNYPTQRTTTGHNRRAGRADPP